MARTQQNLATLRTSFAAILGDRKDDQNDAKVPDLLAKLGLPDNPGSPSKRQHLAGAVLKATDEQRIEAVQRVLQSIELPERERDVLQELLWDDGTSPTSLRDTDEILLKASSKSTWLWIGKGLRRC
jgi:hypothetical protein